MALQDGEEDIVHLQEDAPILGGLQVVQGDREQDTEGEADVVWVADGVLPPPQQHRQDVQNGPNHPQGRGLLPTSLTALQLQDKEEKRKENGSASPQK